MGHGPQQGRVLPLALHVGILSFKKHRYALEGQNSTLQDGKCICSAYALRNPVLSGPHGVPCITASLPFLLKGRVYFGDVKKRYLRIQLLRCLDAY